MIVVSTKYISKSQFKCCWQRFAGISVFALKCYDCKNDDCSELKEVECDEAAGDGCAFEMENCKLFSRIQKV